MCKQRLISVLSKGYPCYSVLQDTHSLCGLRPRLTTVLTAKLSGTWFRTREENTSLPLLSTQPIGQKKSLWSCLTTRENLCPGEKFMIEVRIASLTTANFNVCCYGLARVWQPQFLCWRLSPQCGNIGRWSLVRGVWAMGAEPA